MHGLEFLSFLSSSVVLLLVSIIVVRGWHYTGFVVDDSFPRISSNSLSLFTGIGKKKKMDAMALVFFLRERKRHKTNRNRKILYLSYPNNDKNEIIIMTIIIKKNKNFVY